eukprot:434540_1
MIHLQRTIKCCSQKLLFIDYTKRANRSGYNMVGKCIQCGHCSEEFPTHNDIIFQDQSIFNSLTLSIVESGNEIAAFDAKLKRMFNIIDLPYIADNTYIRYDNKLSQLAEHQKNKLIHEAVAIEKKESNGCYKWSCDTTKKINNEIKHVSII